MSQISNYNDRRFLTRTNNKVEPQQYRKSCHKTNDNIIHRIILDYPFPENQDNLSSAKSFYDIERKEVPQPSKTELRQKKLKLQHFKFTSNVKSEIYDMFGSPLKWNSCFSVILCCLLSIPHSNNKYSEILVKS